MTLKKALAIGTILANLAMPVCAKNYESGLETEIENKYRIDLTGKFQKKEIKNIADAMKSIESMIDRKENGIEDITLVNVNAQDPILWDEKDYASARVVDGIIYMSTAAINGKAFDKNPLADYNGLLAHEIGHLIYEHLAPDDNTRDKMFIEFFYPFNAGDEKNYKEGGIPVGYVTCHPMERGFITMTSEDIADLFSYRVNDRHYADDDTIVQKKTQSIKGYMKMREK